MVLLSLTPAAGDLAADEVPFPQRPPRLIRLVTGEQFPAEWRGVDQAHVELRLSTGTTAKVPRRAVAEIANPSGVVDVWDAAADLQAPAFPPIAAGILHAQPLRNADRSLRLTFNFDDPTPVLWSITIHPSGDCETALPAGWRCDFRQRVVARLGETRRLAVCWNAKHWSVAWGDALIARGTKPPISLMAINLSPEMSADWQNVVLRRGDAGPLSVVSGDPLQDAVILDGETVLYGRIESVDQHGLRLAVDDRVIPIPWADFRQASFAATPSLNVIPAPISGYIAELKRPEIGGLFPLPAERILGALSVDGTFLHPWLGAVPVDVQRQVRPHFQGSWSWLCPSMLHLGDEVQTDLTPAIPQGTKWSGEWTLHEVPQGAIFVGAEIAELEPSGPKTPPTQPYLDEIRAGHWRTELWINAELIGDWNSHLSWRPGVATPERLRLPVPASTLRVGTNTWELRQRPGPDGDAFDDIWIGRLALEVESGE